MYDNHILETFKHEGFEIEIWQDIDVGDWNNPREWEPLGHMICAHRRYELGDEQINSSAYESWDAIEKEWLESDPDIVCWLPLYLYDHSGITMNTRGFSCSWDSGQVGFIYMDKENAKHFESDQEIRGALIKEVEVYSAFLEGDVVGYFVKSNDGDILDSCGGYVGDYEYCKEEAKSSASYLRIEAAREEERKFEFECRDIVTV